MQNLRIVSVRVTSSTIIVVTFTDVLTSNLVPANISIISDTNNDPDSKVLSVRVVKSVLEVTCQPLTNLTPYFITFKSTDQNPFISLNGQSILLEDGVSNKYLILGPIDPDNPIKSYIKSYLKDNIYSTDDDTSVISNYIRSLSQELSKTLYDIRQIKNENYLSIDIVDEKKIRGEGPFDRLLEEGAYEVVRVGRTTTNTIVENIFSFTDFPIYPITLQKESVNETLKPNSVDENGIFNINTLILNLSNAPVTRVSSIVFTLETANPIYTYNIDTLGYQILNSRYDQDHGFSYDTLSNNQIRLSDKLLSDPLFSINKILKIDVQYEYKNEGIIIDSNSVTVYTISSSIREVLPPIINIFNLQHAPIVDTNGDTANIGAITFIDPNSNTGSKHPAFISEIPFRLNALPSVPGQYSIDYSIGTVYVYGSDINNDGTGPFPPLATYNYRFTFKSEQDYSYDPNLNDLVALPIGNLVSNSALISFNYEQVLIPDLDYVSNIHQEVLDERINNNILALNVIRVNNSPLTNVFRVYNETSGEIYTIDRWNDDKVYFRYHTAPTINSQINERTTFNNITNELLFISNSLNNVSSIIVFKILLKNNSIVGSSEDSLASSFNTSLFFSKSNIFVSEKWFDRTSSETNNINRLIQVGEYCVDYINGIVYCAVSNTQDDDIGIVTYKNNKIVPQFPHIISVDDIYYQIDPLGIKNKQFSVLSFEDGLISPETLDNSSELFLNNSSSAPYQIFNESVGSFVDASFVPGVTSQIKSIRGLFEFSDLENNTNPINFANYTISNGFNINLSSIQKNVFEYVQFDGINYYVLINENIPYFSPNITFTFSVIRESDSSQLWDTNGIIIPGNPIKLILSGINSPTVNDLVNVVYTLTINSLSRVVVDYNKGDLFVDYTYLADELLVSYEHGDNVLDFRTNTNLPTNTEYYVSYRVGALREALLKNFGNLVNIPELTNFDLDFDRERYRDAVTAAMTSFIKGPTIPAIKNIGKTISHIEPVITESAFQNWSLGSSLLNPEPIKTTGSFQLLPAKFSNGVLINSPDQTITMPTSSNLRLEDGTFETWIIPQWNGLDNDAELTFNITRDGYTINSNLVFIGSSEYHPEISGGSFILNKNDNILGTPNTNKDGVFIYYDNDISGNFNRWYIRVLDGYVNPISSTYKIKITSNGTFYDSKSIQLPKSSNLTIFTGTNSLNLTIKGASKIDEGVTFLSDIDHYLLDFGKDKSVNRFSLFKDVSGYINFRVYDTDKNMYSISSDVSGWHTGEPHHVAISWKLNTRNSRDEMHLFIDGLEVPNIIKYGQKLKPYLHEKFRTVDPEEILGLSTRDILASDDLNILSGSSSVSSSLNFSSYNISIGDTIFIDEVGFSTIGYTIIGINGQTLSLNTLMPITLTNGRFSINRTQFTVTSDIDVATNITVNTIHASIIGNDAFTTNGSNIITSTSVNFSTQGVLPGDLIRIDDLSLQTTYNIVQVTGNSVTITDNLSLTLNNVSFQIYPLQENELPGIRALHPDYSISKDYNFNNILTISNGVIAHDLILIRTLGLNHRKVKQKYYVWSDGYENVLMTRLPPPISLDEAKITKIILPSTVINTTNSVLLGNLFQSNNLSTSQPSNSTIGRTITAILSGTNVDFSIPTSVTINGISGGNTTTETINFTDYGTLDFINLYTTVNYIQVNSNSINVLKSVATIECKEKYSITYSESNEIVPIVRYSYPIGNGYTLNSVDSNTVKDDNNSFSDLDINNYLYISTGPAAGFYLIIGVSIDRKSLSIQTTIPSFTMASYQILNVNQYRSGFQNGFFTMELSNAPSQPYFLLSGFYELEYETYTKIKMAPVNMHTFIGSDFNGHNQLNGIMDQVKIYSVMLTDTRIGESIPSNQRSITKDFNSIKALTKDINTLVLINFDSYPFINSADYYINPSSVKKHFQSSIVVNENFGNSLVITDNPIIIPNNGILDTKKEGTIEFWMSPFFDTANDPNNRFYFDAYGATIQEATSINNISVKLSSPASQILSVKLKNGNPNIDYFAGGKIEVDTQNAIQEESYSISANILTVSKNILQVIKVQIIGDLTESDYFANGSVGTDKKTIYLGKSLPQPNLSLLVTYQTIENKNSKLNTQIIRLNKKLPYQNSQVIVSYVPQGLQGDRLSIFKDKFGYINFAISASGVDYVVRAPTRWSKNTWHRIKASYKINGGLGTDEMRLFLDGYEYTDVLFGSGIIFGDFPILMGSSMVGDGYVLRSNIKFKDLINTLHIGSQFTFEDPIFSLIDNFRISNLSRPIYAPYGEPIDVNYNSNLEMAFPVTTDLYTTYLLDFNTMVVLNSDFATIKNRNTGSFDFSINILDSFGIVSSSLKVQEALEKLIKVLKPANSRAFIQYTR